MKQGCVMYVPLAFQLVYECSNEKSEMGMWRMVVRFLEDRRDLR